jgi:hypothetical protein
MNKKKIQEVVVAFLSEGGGHIACFERTFEESTV